MGLIINNTGSTVGFFNTMASPSSLTSYYLHSAGAEIYWNEDEGVLVNDLSSAGSTIYVTSTVFWRRLTTSNNWDVATGLRLEAGTTQYLVSLSL